MTCESSRPKVETEQSLEHAQVARVQVCATTNLKHDLPHSRESSERVLHTCLREENTCQLVCRNNCSVLTRKKKLLSILT